METIKKTAQKGDMFNVTGSCFSVVGTESQGWANGLVVVDGEDVIDYQNGSFVAKANGTAKVMFYTTFNNGKVNYTRYSNIVSVTVKNAQRTDNVVLKTDSSANAGLNLTEIILIISSALVICAGATVTTILVIRRKKGNE